MVRQYDGFEIGEPYLVAEVLVPGPAEEAGSRGFQILVGYIFSQNKGERKIAMTAPVAQAAADSGHVVQSTMPSLFGLETLPEPLDPQIRLKAVPGGRIAVIRYSGTWSERNYREHLDEFERGVEAARLRSTGGPIYSRCKAPFVPWFMRRNEIWLKLI